MTNFARAEQNAGGGPIALIGPHSLKSDPLVNSLTVEEAAGFRSMLFGVNTTSGLRQARKA